MNWRRAGLGVLVLALPLGTLAAYYALNAAGVPPDIVDPAVEFHTRDHHPGYGGIDRWAYYGMREETFVELLKRDGYACEQPRGPSYSGRPFGIGSLVCRKYAWWPVPRALTIEASIDYDHRARLVAAKAGCVTSVARNSFLGSVADSLRRMGMIEPETLQVSGFEFKTVDTLVEFAVDLLVTGGWKRACEQPGFACAADARTRRAAGFAALPSGAVRAGEAMRLHSAMEQANLRPPVSRTADGKPEDSLLVRVSGERMWLDFVGKDLTGRDLAIAIELGSEGGTPLQLIATVGDESRTVLLAGTPRRANDGRMGFLVPEAGGQNPRPAIWLYVPRKETSVKAVDHFAKNLPGTDPVFMPRLVAAMVSSLATPVRVDEHIGIYPTLARIDTLADDLRAAGANRWLPQQQRIDLLDPIVRAAWVLALCESGKPPTIDRACWDSHAGQDAEVNALLRQEVDRLQAIYGSLGVRHPIRLRLDRLREALAEGWSGS